MRCRKAVTVTVAFATLACCPAARAAKVDQLTLRNGDRITGEIKALERGRLEYSTDDVGTLSVEWDKVASLVSPRHFDIELNEGRHLYGSLLRAPDPGLVRIGAAGDTTLVAILSVVRINPLEHELLERFDGSVDLGFDLARANDFLQLSLNASTRYRTEVHVAELSLNSLLIRQDQLEDTQRGSLSLQYAHILGNRWFTAASTGLERNSELGIDLRVSLAALGGRFMIQTNTAQAGLGAGLSGNVENPSSDSKWNLEAVLGLGGAYFLYDFPKTFFDGDLRLYRSLTENRTRLEFHASAKREIIKDFTIGLSGVESYDTDPPSDGTKSDWTANLTVGWTF